MAKESDDPMIECPICQAIVDKKGICKDCKKARENLGRDLGEKK